MCVSTATVVVRPPRSRSFRNWHVAFAASGSARAFGAGRGRRPRCEAGSAGRKRSRSCGRAELDPTAIFEIDARQIRIAHRQRSRLRDRNADVRRAASRLRPSKVQATGAASPRAGRWLGEAARRCAGCAAARTASTGWTRRLLFAICTHTPTTGQQRRSYEEPDHDTSAFHRRTSITSVSTHSQTGEAWGGAPENWTRDQRAEQGGALSAYAGSLPPRS